ncbi:MAG TPA: hypothetical protein VI895_08230 [Bdellovibrionota bacterium]|nr:hypothetical protein [Bdellovibrionota bacterium]
MPEYEVIIVSVDAHKCTMPALSKEEAEQQALHLFDDRPEALISVLRHVQVVDVREVEE